MELIDKTAVIEEIDRVLNSYHPTEITSGRYALANLRSFLDTLEVKAVDLEDGYMVDRETAREKSILNETKVEYFATGKATIAAYSKDNLRNQFDAGADWMKEQIIKSLKGK